MKKNRDCKRFLITIVFLLRALLIASIFLFIDRILFRRESLWLNSFSTWFYENELTVMYVVIIALIFAGFFYSSVMIIFKRGEWFERFYDFLPPLILTAPFGACFLIYYFFEQAGYVPTLYQYISVFGFIMILFFTPIILLETIWLGLIIKRTKGYGWFKSQCFAFLMFLFLPLFVTRLVNWLFVIIFLAKP